MMKHLIVIAGLAIMGWAAPALSQEAEPKVAPDTASILAKAIKNGAPTQTSGIESTVLGNIPLEAIAEITRTGKLRTRELVILPGGKIAVHSHDKRPVVVHVLEGELVEHRAGTKEPIVRRQGETYFEELGIVHWSENVTKSPTRVLAIDIIPADPE